MSKFSLEILRLNKLIRQDMIRQTSEVHQSLKDCEDCEGDGYQEKFNDNHSGVITWLCPTCNGSGKVIE